MKWRVCLSVATFVAGLLASFPGYAKQVKLDVAMANPTILVGQADNGKSTNHMRIALTGFEIPAEKQRSPVNVSIVIDKSGSMQGDKIEQARSAAIQAVERMRDSDIVSVVAYDSSVTVVVPATKASDREMIKQKIRSITASGNTALFAGVSKGAAELRKFLNEKMVNRVILLSDGLANVGPKTPSELEELGQSLIKEGISVSTLGLGLGYNEDLMSRLAVSSSGNHVFIEDAENLVQVFQNEFDDVLSVVAQSLVIKAELAEGIRPVKVLNYPSNDITGQQVRIDLGQLYSRQERYFVVEVEVPDGEKNAAQTLAEVSLEYMNMHTETEDKLTSSVQVKFTDNAELSTAAINKDVKSVCVLQIANENNRKATQLRDAGQIDEARKLLLSNAAYLGKNFQQLGDEKLMYWCETNKLQSTQLAPQRWAAGGRKAMVESQVALTQQQQYLGNGVKANSTDPKDQVKPVPTQTVQPNSAQAEPPSQKPVKKNP